MKDDIILRLEILERQVRKYDDFLKDYYENIPLKYRKGFPKADENPLFTHEKFLPLLPEVFELSSDGSRDKVCEIQLPDDPKEYQRAKERMEANKDKHDLFNSKEECRKCKKSCLYFELKNHFCEICYQNWLNFKNDRDEKTLKEFCE